MKFEIADYHYDSGNSTATEPLARVVAHTSSAATRPGEMLLEES